MASERSRRRASRWAVPLHVHLLALVALCLAAAVVGGWWAYTATVDDARQDARREAAVGAQMAASDLAGEVELLRSTIDSSAATPGLEAALGAPGPCSLTFNGTGLFTEGHLDVLRPDGTLTCSSLPEEGRPASFAGAPWLGAASEGSILQRAADPVSGADAVVAVAPIGNQGLLVGVVTFEGIGPRLAERFGGRDTMEFVITSEDGAVVLARSVDEARWAGASTIGTPLAADELRDGGLPERDVDGERRIYGRAVVEPVGWTVHAGVARVDALAAAERAVRRNLAVIAIGMVVAIVAALVVYRQVARPVRQLARAVRAAAVGRPVAMPSSGPREVGTLVDAFVDAQATVERELEERRRAEAAAREAEQNYRLLFDANRQPMVVYDRETLQILEVNDATVSAYGWTRQQLLAMDVQQIRPPEDQAGALAAMARLAPVDRTGPWRHLRADGTVMYVMVSTHDLTFAGRPARLSVVEDVTQRERLERELRQSQRLESLGQLAGGVAHDFNNLLGVMGNYASFAAEDIAELAASDPRLARAHADLQHVIDATSRAAALTRQLLTFARREVAHPQVIDVNAVVRGLEDLLRRTLGEDIELIVTLGGEVSPVLADRGQLEQVLLNLVVNARDAMPAGGTLAVDTAEVDADEDYVARHPGLNVGRYVRLRVSDTGVGMSRDTADRAFEPFFTTKPPGEGTGLGLATVHGIVRQAGGRLSLYSEEGIGTTVSVLLPVTTSPVSAPDAVPERAAQGGGRRVLVVEDDAALREVTRRLLARNGYEVLMADDGLHAVELARTYSGTIDLLLTDAVMPNLSGRETAERVVLARPGIAVLYMSGYAEPVLSTRGTFDGGVLLVEKPFTEQALLAKVAEALDGR